MKLELTKKEARVLCEYLPHLTDMEYQVLADNEYYDIPDEDAAKRLRHLKTIENIITRIHQQLK